MSQMINEYTEYLNRDSIEILNFNEWCLTEKER